MGIKVLTAAEAARLIKSGDTVVTCGFLGASCPEAISEAVEARFLKTGEPRDLLYIFPSAQGDTDYRAANRYAHEGLVRRVIGGHYNLAPRMVKLVNDEGCEAYNLPQGVLLQWLRAIGAGRSGLLTHVGLRTFVDPRVEGGRLNRRTTEDIVELTRFRGEDLLFYKGMNIDVAVIRGTTADENGNLTLEREAYHNESLLLAQAARNTGGIVIAQAERLAKAGSLDPRRVAVPGICVDAVVIAEPKHHMMTNTVSYDPSLCGETRRPESSVAPLPFNERKVLARRAVMEITEKGAVINLGIGMPEGVGSIAAEEGLRGDMVLTVESGGIGGVPLGGIDFGGVVNPDALLPHVAQFDFYDGGGIDVAILGLAQADVFGNVNVSKFNGRIAGCGGFVNITQNAKKVVFIGTLTAGSLELEIRGGEPRVLREGRTKKFLRAVEQITFSGSYASEKGQKVLFITERAVFELREGGVTLTELAPGVGRDEVLAQMDFEPRIADDLKVMDGRLFDPAPMGLRI